MVRRTSRVLVLAATLLLVTPAAALAYAVSAQGSVSGSSSTVDLEVSFGRFDEAPDRLLVRIAGESRGRVRADCVSRCSDAGSRVFRLPISARGGAFDSPTLRHPNGTLALEVRGERERTVGGTSEFGVGTANVTIDVPGSSVGSLRTSVDGDQVRISWDPAPEPGITGYRVERVSDGGRQVTTTGAGGSSAVDRPGPGDHRYRVVTIRSKAGSGSHETGSSEVSATIARPEPEDSGSGSNGSGSNGSGSNGSGSNGSGSNGSGSGGSGSGGSGSGSGGSGSSTGNGSSSSGGDRTGQASAPDLDADDGGSASSSDRSRSRRDARAPEVSIDRSRSGIPELPRVGDVFRGELDFGQGDPEDPQARGEDGDEVVLSAPDGSGGSFLGAQEDAERIAVPVAGGLLLTAIGLHLWRWLKVPLP